MSLVFIPYYIKYLGMEAYGLVGFFALLQACLTFLDMGVSPTVNREMAKFTAGKHTLQQIRNLLHTFEIIILGMSILIIIVIYVFSKWLSDQWVQAQTLETSTISKAIIMMGFVIGLKFIESLYRGAIIGLQHQVWLSSYSAFFATVRGLGALLVLIFVSDSIVAFFAWQVIISIIIVLTLSRYANALLPNSEKKARFSMLEIHKLKAFASSMMLISFLSLLLNQIDKVILSKMVSLVQFGYYTLATTVASTLFQLISPITQAYYPVLTKMVLENKTQELGIAFHNAAKLVSVVVLPIAFTIIFFGENFLYIWTKDKMIAQNSYQIMQILVLGNLLNCFMQIPYILQLANGSTSWAVNVSIFAMLVSVPLTIFSTLMFGLNGAAFVWVIINLGHILLSIHFIKEKFFYIEKWNWYMFDLLSPILITLVLFSLFIKIFPFGSSTFTDIFGYIFIFITSEILLCSYFFRTEILNFLKNFCTAIKKL